MKTILFSLLSVLVFPVAAEVTTLQGSSRWSTNFFRPDTATSTGTTNYITFYLIETSAGRITRQVKVDAWSARNPISRRIERNYYVDREFALEFGAFGRFGTDVGGGMQFDGIEPILPFRGTFGFGRLTALRLYPTADYFPLETGLDITQITGSARLNRSFTGSFTLEQALNAVLFHLESRGFLEVRS